MSNFEWVAGHNVPPPKPGDQGQMIEAELIDAPAFDAWWRWIWRGALLTIGAALASPAVILLLAFMQGLAEGSR